MIYRFARLVIDDERRELRPCRRKVAAQPMISDRILLLVPHREQVVNKQEIVALPESAGGGR